MSKAAYSKKPTSSQALEISCGAKNNVSTQNSFAARTSHSRHTRRDLKKSKIKSEAGALRRKSFSFYGLLQDNWQKLRRYQPGKKQNCKSSSYENYSVLTTDKWCNASMLTTCSRDNLAPPLAEMCSACHDIFATSQSERDLTKQLNSGDEVAWVMLPKHVLASKEFHELVNKSVTSAPPRTDQCASLDDLVEANEKNICSSTWNGEKASFNDSVTSTPQEKMALPEISPPRVNEKLANIKANDNEFWIEQQDGPSILCKPRFKESIVTTPVIIPDTNEVSFVRNGEFENVAIDNKVSEESIVVLAAVEQQLNLDATCSAGETKADIRSVSAFLREMSAVPARPTVEHDDDEEVQKGNASNEELSFSQILAKFSRLEKKTEHSDRKIETTTHKVLAKKVKEAPLKYRSSGKNNSSVKHSNNFGHKDKGVAQDRMTSPEPQIPESSNCQWTVYERRFSWVRLVLVFLVLFSSFLFYRLQGGIP